MRWPWSAAKEERENDRNLKLVELLANAFGKALSGTLEAQAHQIDQNARFLDSLQDLSARKAAQIMGSRGGKRSQERKRATKQAQIAQRRCKVCAGVRVGLTPADIDIHRAHEGLDDGSPENQPNQPQYPLPNVTIPAASNGNAEPN